MNRITLGAASLAIALGILAAPGCAKKKDTDKESAARAALRDNLLTAHHDKCVELFVKTDGFGGGRMIVLSHPSPSYPKSLDLPAQEVDETGAPIPTMKPSAWVMDKVELVSLLNQETPGVYPASGMRRFAAARPKTRELDSFEAAALPALQAGEAVRVQESEGEIRVLGAIRSRADCKSCHPKHEAGSLLGAFTYVIKPTALAAPPAPAAQAVPAP